MSQESGTVFAVVPEPDPMHQFSMLKDVLKQFEASPIFHFESGSYIWKAGDRMDSLFILRRGEVCIEVADTAGRPTIFRLAKPGHIFGMVAFCDSPGQVLHSSAMATMSSDVVRVHREDFARHLTRSPEAMLEFLKLVCTELAEAEKRIRVLSEHGAPERLAALLLQLGFSIGHASATSPEYRRVHCTHAELAQMAALTRSHVSVLMARFRQQSMVRYARNRPMEVNTEELLKFLNRRDREFDESLETRGISAGTPVQPVLSSRPS